jgi:hypothetical protein
MRLRSFEVMKLSNIHSPCATQWWDMKLEPRNLQKIRGDPHLKIRIRRMRRDGRGDQCSGGTGTKDRLGRRRFHRKNMIAWMKPDRNLEAAATLDTIPLIAWFAELRG